VPRATSRVRCAANRRSISSTSASVWIRTTKTSTWS
jgi:hypothetical protein